MKNLDDLVFKNLHGLKLEEDEVKHKHDKKGPGDLDLGKTDDPFSQPTNQADYNKMLELQQQQQQQQMMYNYYMMQQRQQQQNPQYGGSQMQQLPPFNPAFVQNMQNMQNRQTMQGMQNMQPQMNTSVNNPFGMMNMGAQQNQFSQINRNQQVQGQSMNPNMPQNTGMPNISHLPPAAQKQYMQMYQNQMNQSMHNTQTGQFGQMNQNFSQGGQPQGQSNQNFAQFQMNNLGNMGQQQKTHSPQLKSDDFDDFGDFSSSTAKPQQTQGYMPSSGFNTGGSQFHGNAKHDDDFADFQGASHTPQHVQGQQHGHQNLNQGGFGGFSTNLSAPTDDFDDFQDSTGGRGGMTTTQPSTTKADDFDDFQDSSAGGQPKGQNWDLLDDIMGKKLPESASTEVKGNQQFNPQQQTTQPTQMPQQAHLMQQNVNVQMPSQNIHFQPQGQVNYFNNPQQFGAGTDLNRNFYGQGMVGASQENKEEDEFEEFEEAKPDQPGASNQQQAAEKPKAEDLLFGALENKIKKALGYAGEAGGPQDDDFGGFEEVTSQQQHLGTHQPQHMGHQPQHVSHGSPGGDDFDDFTEAGTANKNEVNTNQSGMNMQDIGSQDHKKVSIYDIDWAEYGITEAAPQIQTATQGLTGDVPEEKPQLEQQKTPNKEEDFGDFVEIHDETEKKEPQQTQPEGFHGFYNQGFDTKPQEHQGSSDWAFGDFGSQPAPVTGNVAQNNEDDDFNDFEEPQVKPQENAGHHEEGNDFDDFQVVGSTHNQGDFGEPQEAKKEGEEKNKQGFEGFEFENITHDNQGTDWYSGFGKSEGTVEPKKAPEEAQTNVKEEKGGFDDFGFDFTSVTISAGDKQTTIFNNFGGEEKAKTSHPPVQHVEEDVKQNKQEDEFDDFEEYNDVGEHKQETEKPAEEVQKETVSHEVHKPAEDKANKEEDEDFGDFEGQNEPEKEEKGKETTVVEEEPTQQTQHEDLSKKPSIYDIDWTEYGIQESTLPKMELNFPTSSHLEGQAQHKEEKKPTAINDLYSLYGSASGTPITLEQPKAETLFGETIETQNNFTEQTGKHAASPQVATDDFGDFDDFEPAPKQEPTTSQHAFEQPAAPSSSRTPQNQDLFLEHSQSHGNSGNKAQGHYDDDDDFGNFEQPSKPATQHDISHHKEEPKAHQFHEDDDDGFDNFEEAGQAQEKHAKEEIGVKSLSQFEGHVLQRDASDFGSMNEVSRHEAHPAHLSKPRRSTELDRGISLEAPEKDEEEHDEFGSFTNTDTRRKRNKDESIFHPADSSEHSPAKEKEKDTFTDNDDQHDFGDFVGSKHDLGKARKEVVVEELEQFTLEAVLAEYGIKPIEEGDYTIDLTKYIENRVDEINREYQENLFRTSYARTEMAKPKFKLNRQTIEELTKELSSLQKYKEAGLIEGQITVLGELDELNETKRQLIEDEKLEEAIQYRDLIKNKEKELLPKDKFEEFLSYYDALQKGDYRVLLLEDLKNSGVPTNYINDFCRKFIGNIPKIKKKVEVVSRKPVAENVNAQAEKTPADEAENKAEQNKPSQEDQGFEEFETYAQPQEEAQPKAEPLQDAEEKEPLENKVDEAGKQDDEFDDFEAPEQAKVEDNQQETENKVEESVENKDEGFGDFEAPEAAKTEEVQVKEEENVQGEELQKQDEVHHEESDGGFGDFEAPEQAKIEDKQEETENKVGESAENKDEGFDDFEAPETAKAEEVHVKEEEENAQGEELPKQNEDKESDGGFDDFEAPETAKTEKVQVKEEENVQGEELPKQDEAHHEESDGGFGDFEDTKKEEKVTEDNQQQAENKEEPEQREEEAAENVDEGFGDFESPKENKVQEEVEEKESLEKKSEGHDEDFGDFENPKQGEEENKEEPEQTVEKVEEDHDEGFGDFETPAEQNEEQKGNVAENVEQAEEPEQKNETNQESPDDEFENFENAEQAQVQEPTVEQENKPDEQDDDEGFGDFEGHGQAQENKDNIEPQVQPANEDNTPQNATEDLGQDQKDKTPIENDKADEDFDDFEDFTQNQPQATEHKGEEEKGAESPVEEKEPVKQVHVTENVENQEDFGDFEDFNQVEAPKADNVTSQENKPEEKVEDQYIETYYVDEEEIENLPETPKTLPEVQTLKEETTKWALLAKAIGASGEKFDAHIKRLLNQIVYELHRFVKSSERILSDSNKAAVRTVLTSQKYETYIKGMQLLISYYRELKASFEFLATMKQPTQIYEKPLEELIEKVQNIRSQIEQDFGVNFAYKLAENGSLSYSNGLETGLLAHVCHLSLKINSEELTEYSGKYYFLPYLNFLLNIS